jgi:hypothetical protein
VEEIDEEHGVTMPLKQKSWSSSASADSTIRVSIERDTYKNSGNQKYKIELILVKVRRSKIILKKEIIFLIIVNLQHKLTLLTKLT